MLQMVLELLIIVAVISTTQLILLLTHDLVLDQRTVILQLIITREVYHLP